jgi:hypothetical protein
MHSFAIRCVFRVTPDDDNNTHACHPQHDQGIVPHCRAPPAICMQRIDPLAQQLSDRPAPNGSIAPHRRFAAGYPMRINVIP